METDLGAPDGGRELLSMLSDRFSGPDGETVRARLAKPDMADLKAVVSWRGAVLRPGVCPVSLALSYLDLLQEESCGRCSPCRIGTEVMRRILLRLEAGEGRRRDVEQLRRLAGEIDEASWCGIGNTIRDPLLALLELGEEHFAEHAAGTTCPRPETLGWVTAPCRSTCPSTVDCPSYLFQAAEGHPHLAGDIVRRDNPLPAVIGRTCHHPCESNCTLFGIGEPVAINFVKRWCADRALGLLPYAYGPGYVAGGSAGQSQPVDLGRAPGETPDEVVEGPAAQASQRLVTAHTDVRRELVAVIGAGPAGLSAGYYLARRGYRPVIFEALDVPGGMLYVGIPEYRLPKVVLRREVALIEREGVEIRYGQALGRDLQLSDLDDLGFAATFAAIGAHSGKKLRIPGEDLPGSMDAIDFLREVALGQRTEIPEKVLVIGGGNSAMDAARTAVRMGAREVRVVYRRAREQMPANSWEVDEAMEEGVDFRFLSAPVSCEGDTCVRVLLCQEMELGPPDESGRRSPVPASRAPFELEADLVIAAVGQQPDFSPFAADAAIATNAWGYLEMDPFTFMTTKPGVFVGGDAVSGGGSVIEAIHAGKTVAKYIDAHLRGIPVVEDLQDRVKRVAVYLGAQSSTYPLTEGRDYGAREHMPMVDPLARRRTWEQCEIGYDDARARQEAARCLRCHRPVIVAV
ncbi:MAG: FAD-dependent oxidoreductase [Thermoleophilia bacterium]